MAQVDAVLVEKSTLVGSGAPRSPRSVLQASDSKYEMKQNYFYLKLSW